MIAAEKILKGSGPAMVEPAGLPGDADERWGIEADVGIVVSGKSDLVDAAAAVAGPVMAVRAAGSVAREQLLPAVNRGRLLGSLRLKRAWRAAEGLQVGK